jgi:hypothetical protein
VRVNELCEETIREFTRDRKPMSCCGQILFFLYTSYVGHWLYVAPLSSSCRDSAIDKLGSTTFLLHLGQARDAICPLSLWSLDTKPSSDNTTPGHANFWDNVERFKQQAIFTSPADFYGVFILRPPTVVIREGSERHSAQRPLDRQSRTMPRIRAQEWCHQ